MAFMAFPFFRLAGAKAILLSCMLAGMGGGCRSGPDSGQGSGGAAGTSTASAGGGVLVSNLSTPSSPQPTAGRPGPSSTPVAVAPSPKPTQTVSDFTENVGINIHAEYTDGDYANVQGVINALNYIGVKEVRNGVLNPRNQGQANYGTLAQAGIRFLFVTSRSDIAAMITEVGQFRQKYPNAVTAIEGPNEVNNWPITYQGIKGAAAAQMYQTDLYNAVKSSDQLRDLPVYSFTDWPATPGKGDYRNFHAYAKRGALPDAALREGVNELKSQMPNAPPVCTETGYFTTAANVGWGGVSNSDQAALILRTLFFNYAEGVRRTYIYQLLDAYPDKGAVDQENHYGIFDRSFNPKPAATALRNMLRIMRSETQAAAASPGKVSSSSGIHTLVLNANPSRYFVAVWADNPTGGTTITLSGAVKEIAVYNPVAGEAAVSTVNNQTSINIGLDKAPKILRVTR